MSVIPIRRGGEEYNYHFSLFNNSLGFCRLSQKAIIIIWFKLCL